MGCRPSSNPRPCVRKCDRVGVFWKDGAVMRLVHRLEQEDLESRIYQWSGVGDGSQVIRFSPPEELAEDKCSLCGSIFKVHGILKTAEDEEVVCCPGDYLWFTKRSGKLIGPPKLHHREEYEDMMRDVWRNATPAQKEGPQ